MTNIKEESALSYWKPKESVARWRRLAEYWGRQTECPAALILAVIEQESGGDEVL